MHLPQQSGVFSNVQEIAMHQGNGSRQPLQGQPQAAGIADKDVQVVSGPLRKLGISLLG
jgi:hypothetical protein